MKSRIAKRSIVISGHKTSLSVEDDFWSCLKVIAGEHDITLSQLVGSIDSQRRSGNLSSAVRLFVLDHYQRAAEHERPAAFVSAIDEGYARELGRGADRCSILAPRVTIAPLERSSALAQVQHPV